MVRIPTLKHWQINGWYGRKNAAYGGLSPRDYLRGKSREERTRVGREALILFKGSQTTTNQKLKEMSLGELVERFVAIAIDQDKAIFDEDNTKFNKLYDQMQSVKDELRARPGDQRNALRALLDHPNMQVRLKAAITMLALAPDISK